MERVIVAGGRGQYGADVFDGFEVIAEPLPTRESRVLGRVDDKPGTGCDYGSHSIKLAVRKGEAERRYKGGRSLFILMHHGGGKIAYAVKQMYDGGETERALLAMPEAALYGTLYTMVEMADCAANTARTETAHEWAKAHVEGRIRKRRARGGSTRIEIEQPWETEARKARRA